MELVVPHYVGVERKEGQPYISLLYIYSLHGSSTHSMTQKSNERKWKWSHSVVSNSVRPHRWQPAKLPHPWDSPGKNTGVGRHFLLQCMKVKSEREVAQLCPTLRNPMDYSLPGSSIHGIFQARVLEWDAIAFSQKLHQEHLSFITWRTLNWLSSRGCIINWC